MALFGFRSDLNLGVSQRLKPCRHGVKDIADVFRIRQQRVMAIIALHMIGQQNSAQGLPKHEHFRVMMEGDYVPNKDGDYMHSGLDPCNEAVGSGEKHVVILPRAPHYEASISPMPTNLPKPLNSGQRSKKLGVFSL